MTKRILLAATAAFLSTSALAQTPPEGGRGGGAGFLMRADTNGDGVVTWAEAQAAAVQRFQKMDANHDGVLTADEMPAGPRGAAFKRTDTDGDGKVSQAQFVDRAKQRFDRIDTNHDGKLDAGELQAVRDRMMAMRGN